MHTSTREAISTEDVVQSDSKLSLTGEMRDLRIAKAVLFVIVLCYCSRFCCCSSSALPLPPPLPLLPLL